VPIHPITDATAELIAKIGGEQAARGINLPLGDLIIGASAIELGYGVATSNLRDFRRIPGPRVVQL
jgi:predicted nucleic acid-binding protein